MRAYVIPKGCSSIDELRQVDRPDPRLAGDQVLIRVRATSINYKDQAVIKGQFIGGSVLRDLVPLSDGAGEIVEVGVEVTRFRVGDRVAGTFFQPSQSGQPAMLGGPLDGMLAEFVALSQDGIVPIPRNYSFEQAACLPCAGVTAWNTLMGIGRPLRAGDTVLVLGTGGVSMWALQLARAAGARVIATSSSDEKLARVKTLGASDVINYKHTPEWEKEVLRVTDGRGADCVVEVGGAGTLAHSFQAVARGGKIGLVGFLAGPAGDTNPLPLMMSGGGLFGSGVGDREMFLDLNRAVEVNAIEPVIDRVFPFDEAVQAFKHHASGAFMGKVLVSV